MVSRNCVCTYVCVSWGGEESNLKGYGREMEGGKGVCEREELHGYLVTCTLVK